MSISTLPTWVVGLLESTSDQEKVSIRPGWRWRTTEEEHKTTRDRRRYSVQRAFAKHQKHAGESYPGPLSYFCAHRHDRQVTVFPSNLRTRKVPPNLREPRAPRPITGEHSLRSRPSASGWANGNAASPNSTTGASRLIDRRRWRSVCNTYILQVMSAAPHTPPVLVRDDTLIPGSVSSVRACKIYPVVFFNK